MPIQRTDIVVPIQKLLQIPQIGAIGRWRGGTEIQGASPCTIYTQDLRATCAFYTKYLGLICRYNPAALSTKAELSTRHRSVLWVIAATSSEVRDLGSSKLSLSAVGLRALLDQLRNSDIAYDLGQTPIQEWRVTFADPNGITIVVDFPPQEQPTDPMQWS